MDWREKRYETLDPVLDESNHLVKVNRKIKGETISEKVKSPIILPKDGIANRLIAEHYHFKCAHAGYRRVKAEIHAEGLWICGVRNLLRSVAARFKFCRTRRRPLLDQKMRHLPETRTNPNVRPFENTAVDFFGPLKVKYGGRSVKGGYVCIMTCMVTRALHLEFVTDASTDKLLLAWRRFTRSRGVRPKHVWSDNGTNFVGAAKALRDMMNDWNKARIEQEIATYGTKFEWRFNTPTASHLNGVVESLIRSVRKALDATCGLYEVTYTYEEWQAFLGEGDILDKFARSVPAWERPVGSTKRDPQLRPVRLRG